MAGSRATFIYFGDTGNRLVSVDESNMRALGFSPATAAAALLANAGTISTPLRGNERYINLQGRTTLGRPVSRRIPVMTDDNVFFLEGGVLELPVNIGGDNLTVENVLFTIKKAVRENTSFASLSDDSGLDDGTQD